jgi:hypothetical protein
MKNKEFNRLANRAIYLLKSISEKLDYAYRKHCENVQK